MRYDKEMFDVNPNTLIIIEMVIIKLKALESTHTYIEGFH